MPHELALWGVYLSPFLPVCLFGFGLAALAGIVLARLGWLRYFANPPWVIVALGVMFICVLSWGFER